MLLIADISQNFDTLENILDLIEKVKTDVIKLQYYSEFDLYGSGSKETKLKLEWFPKIEECCNKFGKKLMCTVFSPDKVQDINKYVRFHKIASSEITDLDLLTKISGTNKKTILSCGGATFKQIQKAMNILEPNCVCLMACDVEYPSKRHTIRNMFEIKNYFQEMKIGYSDHSLDIFSMPILVQHYGGEFYEKHVKPDASNDLYEAHALTVSEFNEMSDCLRGYWQRKVRHNPHQRIYNNDLKKWVRPRV